jgi:hypothetical protein
MLPLLSRRGGASRAERILHVLRMVCRAEETSARILRCKPLFTFELSSSRHVATGHRDTGRKSRQGAASGARGPLSILGSPLPSIQFFFLKPSKPSGP